MSYNPNDASSAPVPPHHLPSATQFGAVGSITPASTHAPSPFVSEILQPVLDSCSAQWHLDFLFTPDPVHVDHLNGNVSSRALLSTISATRVASPVLQPSPVPFASQNDHVQAYFMVLPIFTVDHCTVGVGIVSGTASENITWLSETSTNPARNFRLNMRFLLDSNKGVIIMVHDSPDDDLVLLDTACFNSNTSYRSHKAFFHRSSFLPAARRAAAPPRAADLVDGLLAFEDEFIPVTCPVCDAPPPTQCTCSLALPRATHPLDLTHVIRALTPHMGSFEGVVVKHLDPLNKPGMQVVLGLRAASRAITDVGIVTRMRDWSLSDHALRNARTSRPRSPRASGRMSTRAAADLMQQFGIGRSGPPPPATGFSAHQQHPGDCRSDMQPRPAGRPAGGALPAGGAHLPAQGNNVYVLQQGGSNEINIGANIMGANFAAGRYEHNNVVIVQSGRSNGISIGTNIMTGGATLGGPAGPAVPVAPEANQPDTQVAHPVAMNAAARAYGPPPPGAAAGDGVGGAAGAHNAGADEKACKDDMVRVALAEMVRQQKDDVRKQRNRESAKRSNLKKKREREGLEAGLRSMKERAAELRARELVLRHENRRLRKLKERLQP